MDSRLRGNDGKGGVAGDGLFDFGEGDEAVLGLGAEEAEDAGLVHGAGLAPEAGTLRDPFGGGEAGDDDSLLLDVGGLESGYGDGAVDAPVFVEGAAECAGVAGGVADEEELAVAGGHDGLDGVVDFFADALGLVDDDEHVGGVEALELVGLVGGEAEGKAVVGEFVAGGEHGASQKPGSGAVEAANLAPEDVADLAGGGGGGEDDGGGVAGEEPEDGDGGGEAFAEAVASLDGDAAVLGEGFEDLFLPAPELDAEVSLGKGAGGAATTLHDEELFIGHGDVRLGGKAGGKGFYEHWRNLSASSVMVTPRVWSGVTGCWRLL